MCGIAGAHFKKGFLPCAASLDLMALALAHRGPDDQGIEIYGTTALVHRRLSIIDLQGGHQPLKAARHPGVSLIVNGEIYNYQELKATFKGYPFLTGSDAEVLLPLYVQEGLEFLKDIRGMYALALYDELQDRLILARDPFGIKQLYYVMVDEGVVFASEPQALIKAGFVDVVVHSQVRAECLQGRYSPGAESIYRGIKRVLPGEILVFQGGHLIHQTRERVFQISPQPFLQREEALKTFDTLFKESVYLHLRSDAPFGLFLSGGLDSGAILHTLSQLVSSPLKTYTIGFDHTSVHDEREEARFLAAHYGTHHHELLCSQKDFWTTLPLVAKVMDEPIFDHALVPTYLLAQEAAKEVRVILCGEGGDELLAGYRRYNRARLPWWLGGRLMRQRGVFEKIGLSNSHLKEWKKGLTLIEQQTAETALTSLGRAQFIDGEGWLAHSLLIKLDRCLMAHGLEGRTPFLEPQLGRFCLSLPDSLKIRWGQGKWLLRQYLQDTAPHLRPFAKKKGFRVPVDAWMKEKGPRLATLVARQPGIEEIFERTYVMSLLSNPSNSTVFAAWMLLFYALWHQIHVVGVPVSPDTLSVLSKRS